MPIQLHAHMYAIAEKVYIESQRTIEQMLTSTQYEALDLKAAALKKFQDAIGSIITDTSNMIRVVKTVYLEIELVGSDIALRTTLVNAWLIAGKRHGKVHYFGDEEPIPEFAADVVARFTNHRTTLVCRCGHDKTFGSLFPGLYTVPYYAKWTAEQVIADKWEAITRLDCVDCDQTQALSRDIARTGRAN